MVALLFVFNSKNHINNPNISLNYYLIVLFLSLINSKINMVIDIV